MTEERIKTVLNVHNSLRSKIALGQVSGGLNGAVFPAASRMATIKWNQELADFALMNAKQCKMQHDMCHNTAELKFSGQNLGIFRAIFSFSDPDETLKDILNGWFDEYKSANATNIESLGSGFTR